MIYSLNDNGIVLAETQADITPIQRFVYALAKQHHEDKAQEKAKKKGPKDIRRGQQMTQGWR